MPVDRLFGRSVSTAPGDSLIWTLQLSDQLVEAMGGDHWSEPVQFRLERLPDGRLDMWVRREDDDA